MEFDRVDADLARHRDSCGSCAEWTGRVDALDDIFGAALVVTPPPELVARLVLLTATEATTEPAPVEAMPAAETHVFGIALEFAALLLVGIGVFALIGNSYIAGWEFDLARIGDVLQTIALVANAPVIPYVQSLAVSGMEALATLLLLIMGFDRAGQGIRWFGNRNDNVRP
jgi:hypothetical protein